MNCFHFSVSLGYKTTYSIVRADGYKLWIAFIFQYLWDTKQHFSVFVHYDDSCELLSFFSIFGIQNNNDVYNGKRDKLWIAFIFQYLWDTKQLLRITDDSNDGCELLSFFSIFGIQNNNTLQIYNIFCVVNCFHFSVSLGYKTTRQANRRHFKMLWIAFIFQYLWDTKQLEH